MRNNETISKEAVLLKQPLSKRAIGAAIANAVRRLTGQRLTDIPLDLAGKET